MMRYISNMPKKLHPLVQVAKGIISPQDLRIGGELRPESSERVISALVKENFFSRVTTQRMRRSERDIDVLDIAPRQLKRLPQGTAPTNANSTQIVQRGSKLISLPTQLFAKINLDTLRDNADNPNLVSMINGMLNTAYSNDLIDLAMNGVGDDASDFLHLNKGWPQIASDSNDSKKITIDSATNGWIDTLGSIKAKSDTRFRPTSVFIMNQNDADAYDLEVGKHVTGVPLISNGSNRQEFLRQPIVTNRYMPEGTILYTPIKNLIFGISTLMRRDSMYDIEERVVKIVIDMACDFEIAIKEACVVATT